MNKFVRACLVVCVFVGVEIPRLAGATGVGPPANLTKPVVTGTAQDGSQLVTSDGDWEGADPITFTYRWRRCDPAGQACTDVSGATLDRYDLVSADVGHTMVAVVTAQNSDGSQPAASDPYPVPPSVVQALPPQNVSSPTVSGTARDGQTLASTTGTWNGSTPMAFSHQWSRCDSSGSNCASIPGATASTYTLTSGDVGATVR